MSAVASKAEHPGSINNPIKFADQDFEKLKKECLAAGTLFEDPVFPAAPASMGFDKFGPNSKNVKGLEWKRASELKKNPVFIIGGAEREDIRQGGISDCWLLASIACLTMNQECLFHVVPSNQSFDKDYAGIFLFKFWQYGKWMEVVVDDKLPSKRDKPASVKSNTPNEFWSPLLEKAYAKINGSYEALNGGYAVESLVDFTGGVGEIYDTVNAPADLFQRVQRALMEKSLTASSTKFAPDKEREAINKMNVVAGHMYSITGAEEVTCDGNEVKIIRVRNPWGGTEWNGPFSDNAPEWDKVDPNVKARLNVKKEDGEVWMPFDDFLKEFKILEICNIHLSEACSGDDYKWCLTEFNGSWKKEISDGGRNSLARFSINPQYRITLKAQDGNANKKRPLVVSLTQKDRRKHKIDNLKILNIGFYVYKVTPSDKSPLGKEFYKKNKPIFEYFAFYRDVSGQLELPPGEYLIVAATFSESQEADYYLRVFTEI